MIGRRFGHYRILEQIGSGGMGEVFRARDERLGRDVALKVIRPAASGNPDHLHRFEQEARAAAALNHPNIVAIYDVGFEGTTPFIVSELLKGRTLRELLPDRPLPLREVSEYALQIAQGMSAAHERHIVHRDLKPENVFLTSNGHIKILDFGVAKLQAPPEPGGSLASQTTITKSGAVVGTVAYMSPEQLRGRPVDHRSDIFSFGAVLYEMLSGKRAFRGETEVDTMTAVLREEPPEADLEQAAIPRGFKDLVQHCLEKDPENRFQCGRDLTFALRTLATQGSSVGTSRAEPPRRNVRMVPWALAFLLAVAVLVLAGRQLQSAPAPAYLRLTYEEGTVYSARFSPDGHSIIYGAAWNGRPVQMFSTLGNSGLAQTVNVSDAGLLAISKTNDLAVVLHGSHNGQLETVDGMLAIAPLVGGSAREVLSEVRWADWDPAGKNLAVVHTADGHSRLEYPIGTVLFQTSGWISHIRFSPRGESIAFLYHPTLWDDQGTVCLVDLQGHRRTLTPEWEHSDGLAWRADGSEIWFTAAEAGNNSRLMAVTLTGKVRTILALLGGVTLQDAAPDGRVLATSNSKRLAMAYGNLGGKEDTDLSWHDWNVAKDISRDGQFVVFEDASEAAGPAYAVALRKLDGSLPIRLGEGSAGGLSPDGKWVISISTGEPQQVTLLPTGAGPSRTVPHTGMERIINGWGRFLPDGQSIIVNGNEPGHVSRCYKLDLAGGKPKPITPEGTNCGPPSPDGNFLVGRQAGAIAIYPIGGGSVRSIPGLGTGFIPILWSEDGSTLFVYRDGEIPSRIYSVQIATGRKSTLQELHPGVPAGVVNVTPIVLSRNGRRFAYSYNQTLSVLYLISGLQ